MQHNYQVYAIGKAENDYQIVKVPLDSMYKGDHSYRKALPCATNSDEHASPFVDQTFTVRVEQEDVNDKGHKLVLRRIYEIYDKEFNFFSEELMRDLPPKPKRFYPSFESEFSMIDHHYLNSIFFTKILNERGFYKYFVRRNGQYCVETMDDWIPVDPVTRLPPWGLSEKEPWKLILMKAWLKEKKAISAMVHAEPYEFINAFGFPGYRAISLKKEMDHIAVSRLKSTSRSSKEQRIPLDIPGFIVVGKTRNHPQVLELGLVPNRAGYRILATSLANKSVVSSNIKGTHRSNPQLDSQGDDNLYKVHSSLPSSWVGEYSVFANEKIQQPGVNKLACEINKVENEFFASYYEISNVFNKFYITPEYNTDKLGGNLVQDSLSLSVGGHPRPFFFFELRVRNSGFLNLNIELPSDSAAVRSENGQTSKHYSYIKYFMAREVGQLREAELKGFDYYDGEYMKGYHKSLNRFLELDKGVYFIYFKIEKNQELSPNAMVNININSNAHIESFKQIDHRSLTYKCDFIMKSALNNYNMRYGLKTFVSKKEQPNDNDKRNLIVFLSHSFDEIGFGLVSIATIPPCTMSLAMNINQRVFKNSKMDFCLEAHGFREGEEDQTINMVAPEGQAKVAIFERTIRSRQIDEKFPPPEAINFFHIF